jgi:hypothetical protein
MPGGNNCRESRSRHKSNEKQRKGRINKKQNVKQRYYLLLLLLLLYRIRTYSSIHQTQSSKQKAKRTMPPSVPLPNSGTETGGRRLPTTATTTKSTATGTGSRTASHRRATRTTMKAATTPTRRRRRTPSTTTTSGGGGGGSASHEYEEGVLPDHETAAEQQQQQQQDTSLYSAAANNNLGMMGGGLGGGMMSPYGGGMYGSPFGMPSPMMGGMGPFSGVYQVLFGIQNVVFSVTQAVQLMGTNQHALQQAFDSLTGMIDHAIATFYELRALEATQTAKDTEEQKSRRRRLKALRWAFVTGTSYLLYKIIRRLTTSRRRRIGYDGTNTGPATRGSNAMVPYSGYNNNSGFGSIYGSGGGYGLGSSGGGGMYGGNQYGGHGGGGGGGYF